MDTTITRSGEHWDEISLRLYGDEHHVAELMAANYDKRKISRFSYGVELNAPAIAVQTASSLPAWKRAR